MNFFDSFKVTIPFNNYSFLKDPLQDSESWMREQIQNELQIFPRWNPSHIYAKPDLYDFDPSIVRFEIKNHQLLYKASLKTKLNIRFRILKTTLENFCKLQLLPDMCFLISLNDAHNGLQFEEKKPLPVLAFAKTVGHSSILIPDFEALCNNEALIHKVKTASLKNPWEKKSNIVFWRGSATGGTYTPENISILPRYMCANLSKQHPKILDAQFTHFVQGSAKMKKSFRKLGFLGPHVPIEDHLKYRFLLVLDGNSCPYSRLFWMLFGNSLILKAHSKEVQWYYSLLQPHKHYIPFCEDFSDFLNITKELKDDKTEVETIIKNCNALAENVLNPRAILLYFYLVLKSYSKYFYHHHSSEQRLVNV